MVLAQQNIYFIYVLQYFSIPKFITLIFLYKNCERMFFLSCTINSTVGAVDFHRSRISRLRQVAAVALRHFFISLNSRETAENI